ncbi:MAG: STAS domain-containing protein [Eubacterium sp.]|nr:STAS domain-containing protein [Eubacterium sp.]
MSNLNIKKEKNDAELLISLEGRLDTNTSPSLEEVVDSSLDGIEKLIFDMEKLEYISSAGLRVLLSALQTMEDQGEMVLRNVGQEIMDVFEITGFIDDLTIEE